jgi:hypothetical protein
MQILKKSVTTRFKEHNSYTDNNHITLSPVANHVKIKLNGESSLCEHNFDMQNLKDVIEQRILETVVQEPLEKTAERPPTNSQ